MRITIMLINSTYDDNGEMVNTFTEIHTIDNLQNVQHVISTINSIIGNNILYSYAYNNAKLEAVQTYSTDKFIIDELNNYFEGHIGNIPFIAQMVYC